MFTIKAQDDEEAEEPVADEEAEEPVAEVASSNTSASEQPPSSPMHQRRIESVRATSLTHYCILEILKNYEFK